jgi:peptidoglycan pentaglycine glycine transferase (the first glycine)
LELREWGDQAGWDAFVGAQSTGHFSQGWGWGSIANHLGSSARRLAIVDNNSIRAAMQVFINPLGRTGRTHLYIPRGPVIDSPTLDDFRLLVDGLRALAREYKAVAVRIEPNVPQTDSLWPALLRQLNFCPIYPPLQPRSAWVLDIEPDLDTLLANMKPKTRYNIRLAAKRGVEIISGGPDDVPTFYEMYRETAQRDNFFIYEQPVYEAMFDTYWKLGQLELLLARYQGAFIAGITLVHLGRTVWYLHGASRNEHRNVMAPYLLQWCGIQWAKARGAVLYDFRSVPDTPLEGQDMYGLFRFKRGFGGQQVTVLETYAYAFQPVLFHLWRAYTRSRFAMQAAIRQLRGLPVKQYA